MNSQDKNPETLRMQCGGCGKTFKFPSPGKPGKFTVQCPHCSNKIKVTISEKTPAPEATAPASPSPADHIVKPLPRIEAPVLGEAVEAKPGVYVIKTRAIVNRPYKVVCPKCNNDVSLTPTVVNEDIIEKCAACGSQFIYRALPKGTEPILIPKGFLQWKEPGRFGLSKKKQASLKIYANTIGRADVERPSDIMIEGDGTMSRHSVEINAVPCNSDEKKVYNDDHYYKLRVLNAKNAVKVNARPVGKDEEVTLNYGDIIEMGETQISFIRKKEKK